MYSPKKLDFSKFGRQRASQMTTLVGVLLQLVIVGIGVAVFSIGRYFGNSWVAALLLLLLAGASFPVYVMILKRMDRLALERRDSLVAELCRA
jgi:ABC-2 type transport system permease protein